MIKSVPASTGGRTRGDRTRAAVVAAARAHFADDGYEGATGARIAATAGVSEPTIAHHFGGKAGLLAAVIRDYYDALLTEMDEVTALGAALPPHERLRAFGRWWLATNAPNYRLLAIFGLQGRHGGDEVVAEAFVEGNRRVTRELDRLTGDLIHAGALRADINVRMLRDAFFGTAEHIMIAHAATGRPLDLDAAADDLIDLLLNGASKPPEPAAEPLAPAPAEIDRKLDEILRRLP